MKTLAISILLAICINAYSQSMVNNGGYLVVTPNTHVYSKNNLKNLNSGTINLSGSLTVDGTLNNEATMTVTDGGSLINYVNSSTLPVEIHRTLDANRWVFVSKPVVSQSVDIMYGAYVKEYIEPLHTWEYLTAGEMLKNMNGYAVWQPASSQTIVFSGTPNAGLKSIAGLTHNVSSPLAIDYDGWHLIANPYPSSIDWEAAEGWTKTNIFGSIYLWNGINYSYYIASGALQGSGLGINNATQYIPPTQAFFVKTSGNGTISMDNRVRLHSQQIVYKKSNNQDVFILKAKNLQFADTQFIDETAIRFIETATKNFDGNLDAIKLLSANQNVPLIYSITDNFENLAINSLPLFNEIHSIPLGFKTEIAGNFEVNCVNIEYFNSFDYVYLEDKYNETFTNLRNTSSYNFNSEAINCNDRFVLHFSDNAINNNEELTIQPFNIYSFKNNIYVDFRSEMINNVEINIYNLFGQTVINQKFTSAHGLHTFKMKNMTASYVVKVVSDKKTLIKKVIVNE